MMSHSRVGLGFGEVVVRVVRGIAFAFFGWFVAGCGAGSLGASSMQNGPGAPASGTLHRALAVNDAPLLPPAGTIYLGGRIDPGGAPYSQTLIAQFESQIGRTLALDDHYYGWTVKFPTLAEADDIAHGRTPVIAWNCLYSNASVAAGMHDGDIINAANNIKAFGHPIFLRWFWEMNLTSTANARSACYDVNTDLAGGIFSPANFVAAWQHVHDVFVTQGVTNVVWLWNPSSAGAVNIAGLGAYYPGDAYVDWAGFDSYAATSGQPFAPTLNPMYKAVTAITNAPILVAETATIAKNQTAWLKGADATLAASFPSIKGFMYFDAAGPAGDWSLSAAGLTQFTILSQSPYVAAMPPSGGQ